MGYTILDDQAPTLETVNLNLLKRLNEVIESLDTGNTEGLLNVTEAVAKLNASSKNNDMLGRPQTAQEDIEAQISKNFKDKLGEGEIIGG